eukprot:85483-Rhodomonas_salina.4
MAVEGTSTVDLKVTVRRLSRSGSTTEEEEIVHAQSPGAKMRSGLLSVGQSLAKGMSWPSVSSRVFAILTAASARTAPSRRARLNTSWALSTRYVFVLSRFRTL